MSTAVSEAVRLLREAAENVDYWSRQAGDFFRDKHGAVDEMAEYRAAADAMEAYFADPQDAEVERLTRALYDGCRARDRDADGIRAVLKAAVGDRT